MTLSNKEQIIQLFTSNPESSFHMRGIGRILKKEPGVFQRAINALVEEGILESEYRANARFFRLAEKYRPVPARQEVSQFDTHLHALINSASDRICSRDTKGGLLAWNKAFADSIRDLFGVEPYVGLKTWELIPPDLQRKLQNTREAFRKVYAGETVITEYEYPMPDGEIRSLETSWVPVWSDGEVVAAGEVTRDVTHRKRR
jgi:PAS domain S-box-containing protein